MADDKILICIASHYYEGKNGRNIDISDKLNDVFKCIDEFFTYSTNVTIFIDTNSDKMINIMKEKYGDKPITCFVHTNLVRNFDLTWKHRQHFIENIDNFDWFLYAENDMFIPRANFLNYKIKFPILIKYNAVPAFIRVEINDKDNQFYISDCIRINYFNDSNIPLINNKKYVQLDNPYHAFWILPQYYLKNKIHDQLFVKEISNYFDAKHFPELGASYPMWQLGLKPLVELNSNNKIDPICWSFHLGNVSIHSDTPYGKIRVSDIVQIYKPNKTLFKQPMIFRLNGL
jgi:hypothetical protein